MNILAFDTSTEILHIALSRDSQRFIYSRDAGLDHASTLPSRCRMLLEEAAVPAKDLDAVACGTGPGSFTGLRIGFGFAKGICAAADIPLIAVPSLDLFAAHLSASDALLLPVIDARKDRFYTALYRSGQRISDYLDAGLKEILGHIDAGGKSLRSHHHRQLVIVCGPHASVFSAGLNELRDSRMEESFAFAADPASRNALGEMLLISAEKKYSEGCFCGDEDGPIYIRQPV